MENLFTKITKKGDEYLLLEAGILGSDGRLTTEGRNLFIDLLFSGKTTDEAKKEIIDTVKKEREEEK